jgi:hypothetical protein
MAGNQAFDYLSNSLSFGFHLTFHLVASPRFPLGATTQRLLPIANN